MNGSVFLLYMRPISVSLDRGTEEQGELVTSGKAIYDRIVYVRSYYATQELQKKEREIKKEAGAVVIQKEKEEKKKSERQQERYN